MEKALKYMVLGLVFSWILFIPQGLGINVSSSECYNNETVMKTISRQICDDDGCEIISITEYENCENGCYEGTCIPDDTSQIFIIIGAVIFVGIGIYLFTRGS